MWYIREEVVATGMRTKILVNCGEREVLNSWRKTQNRSDNTVVDGTRDAHHAWHCCMDVDVCLF